MVINQLINLIENVFKDVDWNNYYEKCIEFNTKLTTLLIENNLTHEELLQIISKWNKENKPNNVYQLPLMILGEYYEKL